MAQEAQGKSGDKIHWGKNNEVNFKGISLDGAEVEIEEGLAFLKTGPGTSVPANAAQLRAILDFLKTEFGEGAELRGETFYFTPERKSSVFGDLLKGVRTRTERKLKEAAGMTPQLVRDNGMVSRARELLGPDSPASVSVQLETEFADLPDLENLIEVALREAQDPEKNKKAAKQLVKKMDLGGYVYSQIGKKEEWEIKDDLVSAHHEFKAGTHTITRCDDELKEIIAEAFEAAYELRDRADVKANRDEIKEQIKNEVQSRNPAAEAFKWDGLLRQHGLVSTIRYLRDQNIPDEAIREQLDRELESKGIRRRGELINYAFNRVHDTAFNERAADFFVFNRNLHEFVIRAKRDGKDEDDIAEQLRELIHADDKSKEEVKEIIAAAFKRAEAGKKWKDKGVEARSKVPFVTEESKWDNFVIDEGMLRLVRAMRAENKDEVQIRYELEQESALSGHKNRDELIDYLLRHAEDKKLHKRSAVRLVEKNKWGELVNSMQTGGVAASEEMIRTALTDTINEVHPNITSPEELKEIIDAAFEAAKWINTKAKAKEFGAEWAYHKPKRGLNKAWDWIKNDAWTAAKAAPGKTYDFIKHNAEIIKTGLKYAGLGVALATAGTAAAVLGVGWVGWQGLKLGGRALKWGATHAAPIAWGGLRLGGNIVKHVATDGVGVVKAAAQTVFVNAPKAIGRMISSPFVRAYQGFNWGRKYPAPASKVHVDKWWKKPYQWTRNGISSLAYRGKQAALATTLGLGLMTYGAGEGIVNAASQDLIGTQWHAPELTFFASSPTHAAPHAEAGHGGGHPPDDHAHAAPAHH